MRYKSSTGCKTGTLQRIPLPATRWDVVLIDFITHLPVSDGFDVIMVVVDKLSKRPVYIPTHTTATTEDTAKLFFNNVIRYYGIPSTIISDRDPKFTSQFWTALSRVEHASRFVQHSQQVIEQTRKNLLDAQGAQKKYYDKRRAKNPFKFIPRFIGPYTILEIQGNVALLDLPANLKHLSPRFNIDKIKVYSSNPDRFTGRVIPKSAPVTFDDDGEPLHVVETLSKKLVFNRQPEYLVKWHGLPHHANTWERERDIKYVSHWQELLKDLRHRARAARA
uniref:Chromo domain-containing protein n=1 Tax=Phytophthora ramorum TaxID=164328 RepID=H3GRD5_PHYRM